MNGPMVAIREQNIQEVELDGAQETKSVSPETQVATDDEVDPSLVPWYEPEENFVPEDITRRRLNPALERAG